MIVQKYGGSSLGTIDKMRRIATKIALAKEIHGQVIVVVSAMGKTTNNLLGLAKSASMNPSKRELDMLLSTGEQVSTSLLSMMLQEIHCKALSLNGFQAGIHTVGLYTKNKIKDIDITHIEKYLADDFVVLVTGFQGYNPENGDITTLGRGGSDTTAVALAAKFGCSCEIYTDVDGIHTVDPQLYEKAKKIPTISYEEMSELAYLGARIMEVRAVEIAKNYHVPLRITQAHETGTGTWVKEQDQMLEQKHITGVSVKDDIVMLRFQKLTNPQKSIAHLFSVMAENEVNVDMISQTMLEDKTANIAFTCDVDDLSSVKETAEAMVALYPGFTFGEDQAVAKISVVGIGMRSQSGVAASMFRLFSQNGITFSLVTTSDISISYTIPKSQIDLAVRLIATQFDL